MPGEAPPEAAVIDETTSLARQGDPVAEHELARRYAAGRGVPQSDHERMLWLVRAAEHGNVDAQYELGIALRHGHGTVQDFARSAHWLQRAAERGNALAQYELGLLYRTGTGIATDNVKAYTWLNLAAAQGVAGAATARDAVLRQLSPAETRDAQAEARRLSEAQQPTAVGALNRPGDVSSPLRGARDQAARRSPTIVCRKAARKSAMRLEIRCEGVFLCCRVQFSVERPQGKDVARDILGEPASAAALIDEQLTQERTTHFRTSPIRRDAVGQPGKLGHECPRLHVRPQHVQPFPCGRKKHLDRLGLAHGDPLGVVVRDHRQCLRKFRVGIDARPGRHAVA